MDRKSKETQYARKMGLLAYRLVVAQVDGGYGVGMLYYTPDITSSAVVNKN